MKLSALALLLLGVLATAAPADPGDKKDAPPKKRSFTVGKETTYVTGPLDADGRIDYPAALNARLARGVTPDTNAVALLVKAFGPRPGGSAVHPDFCRLIGIAAPPEKGDYYIDMTRFARERLQLAAGKPRDDLLRQQYLASRWPWTAEQYPNVAAWLKANEKPLAIITEATRRPDYFFPQTPFPDKKKDEPFLLIGASLAGVQLHREVAIALCARAMLRVGRGEVGEAWQDILTCYRLGRQVGRGVSLIEALVGIAIDDTARQAGLVFLDRAKLDAKQLDACLRDLQQLPPLPDMAEKVDIGQRFLFLDCVMLFTREDAKRLGEQVDLPPAVLAEFKRRGGIFDWDPLLRKANRWYDRLVATMREKDRAVWKKKAAEINAEIKKLGSQVEDKEALDKAITEAADPGEVILDVVGDITIKMLMPAWDRVKDAGDQARQSHDNLLVAFVLARYRLDHGRYPKELAALAPKYVKEVPADLFSGKPLVYRPTEAGYRLSSVGVNGKDEEGRGRDDDPPADDLTVRMPVPEPKRKQP